MKLHFDPNLDYQHAAIESVCDLFRGQEICRTEFTVTRDAAAAQQTMAFAQSELGVGSLTKQSRLHKRPPTMTTQTADELVLWPIDTVAPSANAA